MAVILAVAIYGMVTNAGATIRAEPQANLTYVVRAGDTLYGIARRFNTTAGALSGANGLANPNVIAVGQTILVPVAPLASPYSDPNLAVPPGELPALSAPHAAPPPPGTGVYTVASGDTLYSIARRLGVTVHALASANAITDPTTLRPGQTLRLPSAGTPPGGAPEPTSTVTLPVGLFGSLATDHAKIALIPSFDRYADTYRIPRDLLKGLAFVESGWRPDAVSSSGALGIGQLLPSTATWVATSMLGEPFLDPTRAEDNIKMTARYLRYLLDQTNDEGLAVASYFQGLGSVRRDGLKEVTVRYVHKVATARAAFAG